MTEGDVKEFPTGKIHDDGTAPVFQADGFGGAMVNVNKDAKIIKFNILQDIPIMGDANNFGIEYVQRRVIARLVMTPAVLREMSKWINSVVESDEDDDKAGQ